MIRIYFLFFFILITLIGCATPPPKNPENLCAIFRENRDWYFDAKAARERWGVPIHIPMAMMYQESSFRSDALPPRDYLLGLFRGDVLARLMVIPKLRV